MKKKKIIIVILIGMILSGILLMYKSFALFTTDQISKSAITIKAGTMIPTVKVDGAISTTLTVLANSSKTFTVTVENLNGESGKFLFYYLNTLPTGVKFGYLEETGKNTPPNASGVTLAKSGKQTYSLYLANTSSSSVTINLGSLGGLTTQPLSLPSNGHIIEKTSKSNSNITNIWKYDQTKGSSTFCVTGEESTCQSIDSPETYTAGTIIKYKVNNSEEKYFHVMFDNGDTLTLQQRENIVNQTAWYGPDTDNRLGPITLLTALENATKGWTNVLDQTYTLGTTVFKTNAKTGCESNSTNMKVSCYNNQYTLGTRTAKARLITVQEADSFGCLAYHAINTTGPTCPIWMYNYLMQSIDNGGTVNYGQDNAYWTSSAFYDARLYSKAWFVAYHGNLQVINVPIAIYGGRAVVVISK